MTRTRLVQIHALLLLLVGASLYDTVTGKEHWPISPYAMYSGVVNSRSLTLIRAFGVTVDVPEQEIPLLSSEFIHPFDPSRFNLALRLFEDRGDPAVIREALEDCLERYDARRVAGLHDGPPFRAIRLYRLYWKLDARAANADRPHNRKLIGEVVREPR